MKKTTLILALAVLGGAYYHYRVVSRNFIIAEQGSFAAGGAVLKHDGEYKSPYSPDGQTFHGDHAYVFYQKPYRARPLPLVFVHGIGQFSKTWETTPDGRDGFQNIFLKKGFSVYLTDQARRGGRGAVRPPPKSSPFSTSSCGSTDSASAHIPIISTACSSNAAKKRWINFSVR